MKKVGFIILGGTGDLSQKKLIPAIDSLVKNGFLDHSSYVVGIGRSDYNDNSFRSLLNSKQSEWKNNNNIHYFKSDFKKKDFLKGLDSKLDEIEKGVTYGRIYYLAVGYDLIPSIIDELKNPSLYKAKNSPFRRVVFEKPFGDNLFTSSVLNEQINSVFDEADIYRIDHYLGKETVQNLLGFRFSNPFFESMWRDTFIDQVKITVNEDVGVKNRIAFYDKVGAIKDMVQSHFLGIIALITMEDPEEYTPNGIHNAKLKALKNIRISDEIITGQYEGYDIEAKEKGIENTKTETYLKAKLICDNDRWRKTTFIIKTGKCLPKRSAYIDIIFNKEPCKHHCLLHKVKANKLRIKIQPTQDICLFFNQKDPESENYVQVPMSFCRSCVFKSNSVEAYESLLLDITKGDKTLFMRIDELMEAWRITDALVSLAHKIEPKIYPKGSEPKK